MSRRLLEIEMLVTEDERRLTDMETSILVDPYSGDPPSRRKDHELARVLRILDEIESERGIE
jgi:hypothetical protein